LIYDIFIRRFEFIPSWHGSITLHIKNIRGLKELSNVSKHKFKSSNKDVIYQVYKENWGKQMLKHSEGKLCSYSKFKTYFGLEKYFCILKSFEQRRNLLYCALFYQITNTG
jgi:hypothetical protein